VRSGRAHDSKTRPHDNTTTSHGTESKDTRHVHLARRPVSITPVPQRPASSFVVTKRVNDKRAHYRPLIEIATAQAREGQRVCAPVFVPGIVSTYGELSTPMRLLCVRLVGKYQTMMSRSPPRSDGRVVSELTNSFRRRLFTAIAIAVATGTALLMLGAGARA